ncbi:PREDICTED: golgin subfamily A member 7B-like, partial [Rhagoletis zephyria]|uniref:golgin subfamily A member 7B-like n=1 Tax=Rhagoletis zephyria TaxID=28612 RepID=UPI00081172AB
MSQGLTSLQGGSNKVFIQRDYSEGTSVKFHTRLPSELEGLVERQVFESTINRLNEFFAEAEKGSCSTYCEGCIGCITAYLVYMCSETHYEKVSAAFISIT